VHDNPIASPMPRPSASYFVEVQDAPIWIGMHREVVASASLSDGLSVLDVGCGPGLLCRMLSECGCFVTGVDRQADMVAAARSRSRGDERVEVVAGDAERLPFPDHAFDRVFMTNLMFFLADPIVAVAEMRRVCRPGGQLITLNPAPRLNRRYADDVAAASALPDHDRVVLANWARLAEINGTIDGDLWSTMAALVGGRCLRWLDVGVGAVGSVGVAAASAEWGIR